MNYNSIFSNMFSLLTKLLGITFAIGLLLCFSGCSGSADYEVFAKIHGLVTDYQNGTPLENARVALSPSGLTRQTDANGYYIFEELDAQQYTIIVQKSGYQPNRKIINAVSGETQQVDIQLTVIQQ